MSTNDGTDYPKIALPAELDGHELIASVSGGKDSTALMLALTEARIPFRAVFADTGWEHADVYSYLARLTGHPAFVRIARRPVIDTVRADTLPPSHIASTLRGLGMDAALAERLSTSAMVARMLTRAGFPARTQRWCTRELKIEPIMAYAGRVEDETGRPSANIVGVRADESAKRAKLLEQPWGGELEREAEGPNGWGSWVWRPLIRWSVDDVLRIHLAHDVPVNPLYKRGHDRVGCWPCIHSNKEEIRLMAESDDDRIVIIRALEAAMTELRRQRNEETPERYAWASATFFQGRQDSPTGTAPGIDTMVSWSRTARGGRQLVLLDQEPTGGCMRWGLCDMGER